MKPYLRKRMKRPLRRGGLGLVVLARLEMLRVLKLDKKRKEKMQALHPALMDGNVQQSCVRMSYQTGVGG